MKKVLIVSTFFPPSNLAGAQRARILATGLRRTDWQPIVVTVDSKHYEETNDPAALALVPKDVTVENVEALPVRICRPLGFGDPSLRAQFGMRRRVAKLVREGKVDLVFCTVLPGYTSLVGAWAKRTFGLPFVLDYQDPWLIESQLKTIPLSKAALAYWLAARLEPNVVRATDALTAVSDETLSSLRNRRLIKPGLPIETIPIGSDPGDHQAAAKLGNSLIARSHSDGIFHLVYAGTVIEGMLPSVRTLFQAIRSLVEKEPQRPVKLHFIGTTAQPDGRDRLGLAELATSFGLANVFCLEPRRIGYLDALRTMQDADVLLLLGSQDTHYTASKIFPCWLSGKPVFALFHAVSTVNQLARELGGIQVVNYDSAKPVTGCVAEAASGLGEIRRRGISAVTPRNEFAFEPYSSQGIARRYATLFDRVLAGKN